MRSERWVRALFCACALATSCLAASPASADIPPECGTRESFDSALKQRLGDDAPVESVQVAIERRASGFHLRVRIDSEQRELEDENCSELLRAAVVVAVAILLHEPPSPSPPTAEPAQPATPPKTADASERPRFTLAAGAGVSAGTLPEPVLGLELESKVLWRSFGLGLALRYLAPGEKRDAQARGVRLQAAGAGFSGIFRPSRAWEARLGFAAQYLFGKGFGEGVPTFTSRSDGAWAAGPTLGLGFIPLERPPLWASVGGEGQLNLVRGNFRIRNYSDNFYDVPWLSGSAFVRLGLSW